MHASQWSLFAFLLMCLSPLSASAQTGGNSKIQNFQDCLNNYTECDHAQLNAEERREAR